MDELADATTGNAQRYAGEESAISLLTLSLLDSKQEQPPHMDDIVTSNIPTWTRGLYTESGSDIFPCFPSMSETNQTQWMLDSGTSWHFTFNINDFVVYEAIPEPIQVLTATTTTNIVGMCQNHSADADRARAKGLVLRGRTVDVFTP
jgi:hypothetical protein